MNPLQRNGLLKAIADRAAGDKVRIADLARAAAVTQAEAVAAIEQLIADGRLEAATLRPPALAASATQGAGDAGTRPAPCTAPVRRTQTGKVSRRAAYCQLPAACIAPKNGPCPRCQAASCANFNHARRNVRDVTSERRAAASRRSQTAEAAQVLDANPDAIKGRNASITAAMGRVRRQREDEARAIDPVEQAKLALRKRGRIVFDASVDGGRKGRFFVSGQNHPDTGKRLQLTQADLIALARRVNPLALRTPADTIQGRAEQ
jgi:hypothetical protein